jgi:putative transposase
MKLTKKKIRWIIRQKEKKESSGIIAKIQHITRRRVDQLWKQYRSTGVIPILGEAMGRPKKPVTAEESTVIDEAYRRFRYGARMLEKLIRKASTLIISHNRIHRYLMDRGLARAESSKRKQRKWVRYERKHSMSAGHIDWHEDPISGLKICAVLDDSSRKILAIDEFATINTENSIVVVQRAIQKYGPICPLRELIMDHGSELGAHRRDENGDWDREFKQYLGTHDIRPILARVKHPQTNGKIEKWFDTYKRFRYEFASLDEFIVWYNNRPHGSLDFDNLESPELAFWRRLPQAAILGIGINVFGW